MAWIVLQAETDTCVRLLGASNVGELGPRFVSASAAQAPGAVERCGLLLTCLKINTRMVERDIYDGPSGLEKPKLWSKPKL